MVINFTLQATHDIQTQRRWCGGGRTDGGDLFIELMRCDDECARLDQVTGPRSFFSSLTYTCCAVIITLSGGGGAARWEERTLLIVFIPDAYRSLKPYSSSVFQFLHWGMAVVVVRSHCEGVKTTTVLSPHMFNHALVEETGNLITTTTYTSDGQTFNKKGKWGESRRWFLHILNRAVVNGKVIRIVTCGGRDVML